MAKVKTRSQLVKEYDSEISKYIRLSYAENGRVACVSCGVKKPWKEMQAGHYCSRSHYATRWDSNNVYPQCPACNVFKGGNYPSYSEFLYELIGKDGVKELIRKSKTVFKISNAQMIEETKNLKEANNYLLKKQ